MWWWIVWFEVYVKRCCVRSLIGKCWVSWDIINVKVIIGGVIYVVRVSWVGGGIGDVWIRSIVFM